MYKEVSQMYKEVSQMFSKWMSSYSFYWAQDKKSNCINHHNPFIYFYFFQL